MSFNIPNTFVAGTKAKADEVNENFAAIQEEINTNRGALAQIKEELDYVKNDLTDDFIAESEMLARNVKSRFCINFSNMAEDGVKTDLFQTTGSVIKFKVGGEYPILVGTNGFGESETFDMIEDYDVANKPDGEYNIFLTMEGNVQLYNTAIFRSPVEPRGVRTNDIWLMTLEPWCCYMFNGISWIDFEGIPLGKISVSSGQVEHAINNVMNTQYLDSDCRFLTQRARNNLSKRYETSWFTPVPGRSYIFEHNLNLDPTHSRARVIGKVKANSGGYFRGDIIETLYSNYSGQTNTQGGYVLKYTPTTLTLGVGQGDSHCFNNIEGFGDLKKSNVDIKVILTQDIN